MPGRFRVEPGTILMRGGWPHAQARGMTTNTAPTTTMDSIHDWFRQEGLVRVRDGRVLGGVLAGLGGRLGIEPWPARLLFLIALMLIPGSQLLIYPLLWVLMPAEDAWVRIPADTPRS